jgi:hypothetical protein
MITGTPEVSLFLSHVVCAYLKDQKVRAMALGERLP